MPKCKGNNFDSNHYIQLSVDKALFNYMVVNMVMNRQYWNFRFL